MGKLTIAMAIFNSYVSLPEGKFLPEWGSRYSCQLVKFEGPVVCFFQTQLGSNGYGSHLEHPQTWIIHDYTTIYNFYPRYQAIGDLRLPMV